MRSAILIILSAVAASSTQDSLDSLDWLVDKIFDRSSKMWPSARSELENTTLGKGGALAVSGSASGSSATLAHGALRSMAPKMPRPISNFKAGQMHDFSQRLPQVSHASSSSSISDPISELRSEIESEARTALRMPKREADEEDSAPDGLVSEATLLLMEKDELLNGQSVHALRRFSNAMEALPQSGWEKTLRPAFGEMAFNLESFNPVFTSCLMQVQMTVGESNYERRDQCLQRLIQPLAGEYGLHAGEPLGKTHRKLFKEWFESIMGGEETLEELMQNLNCRSPKAKWLFQKMMMDIETAGQGRVAGDKVSPMEKACYALGYNLAVEYLAHPEKMWMLEAFKKFDEKVLKPLGRHPEYEFLVVHAIGEKEHAHLGHEATTLFVPKSFVGAVRRAMRDHDRDLAAYYNHLSDILEGRQSEQC